MSRKVWLVLIVLAPVFLVALGLQVALTTGLAAGAQLAWASQSRSSSDLVRGLSLAGTATGALDRTLNSPPARLLDVGGVLDDIRASARVLGAAGAGLAPAGILANAGTGWDGNDPLIVGSTVDVDRLPGLVAATAELDEALGATRAAIADVPGTGPLGRRIAHEATRLDERLSEVEPLLGAASAAMPDLAEALGAQRVRYYLVCGLNDAELFGSGGAPLYAGLIKADRGTLSVELTGQMESKLSPGNPPITWDVVGGPPWYRPSKRYPFVNSNFHPDFGIAAQDMARAWAAIGYSPVDGVVTMDLNGLATILEHTGPVRTEGFGLISSKNVVRKVLVDSYREFGSQEVAQRHARNDELADVLITHFSDSDRLPDVLRGILESIPPRHVQAGFAIESLNAAAQELDATGALADARTDLIAAHSQSAPNKMSVFQKRRIVQRVRLTESGGATVRRRVTIANAVPPGLPGDPTLTHGYEALRARLRVAHRLPEEARAPSITTRASVQLVPVDRTGPFLDDRGGKVLWQGYEIAPGDNATDVITYRIPDGTFEPGTYELWADPQAMTLPVELTITVIPADGQTLERAPQWTPTDGGLTWSGTLDHQIHLEVS